MKINEYKEEIYKCSGCGLCQSVCPVYKILQTECAVSRGKFKLLNSIINQDIKFSKRTLEIMDLCLHCGACSEFCPSDIDAQKIIETAQADMLELGIFDFRKLFFAQVFGNKFYLTVIKFFVILVRNLKILEILSIFKFKRIELLKSFLKINIKPLKKFANVKKEIKVVYFAGCFNNYLNPSCSNAVFKVFDKTNVEIITSSFNCCGLPLKSAGDMETFVKIARTNIDSLPQVFDYLIFDCQSCKNTFLEYSKYLEGDYKIKALELKNKCKSIYEILDIINYEPRKKWKNSVVTCHYPCHTRFTEDKKIMRKIINKISNITFVEAKNADACCGAAGSFLCTHPVLSRKISKNKAKDIIASNAQIVLTSCPSCYLGLKQGLLEQNSNIKVLQLIEFLVL